MNQLTRMPPAGVPTDPSSNWWWDGSNWQCGCPDGGTNPPIVQVPPCPPFFPPPITQPPWYPGANGGVSFGTTAPPNPIRGSFWWDGKVLWMFDGAAWVNTATGATQGGGSGGGGGGSGSGQGTVIISTTPPGNPQTGAQWWDGSVLRMWDGTTWQIIGPGSFAGPVPTTTHTFRMVQGANVNIAVNTWQAIPFTAVPQVDPQMSFNATNLRIQPTKAGTYLWFVRAYLQSSSGGDVGIGLVRNDTGTVSGSGIEWTALSVMGSGVGFNDWLGAGGIAIMNGTTDYMRAWAYTPEGIVYGTNAPIVDAYLLP